MAKLTRVFQNIFGVNAGATEIAEFGSLAAGSPLLTSDPIVIQSLANWTDGWFSAILGSNSPCIEDMNAVCYLAFRQLAYLFQAGIAEWDSSTTYYIGSLVNSSGVIYKSITNANINHAVTDASNWAPLGGNVVTVTTTYSVLVSDDLVRADATGGSFSITLPTASLGRRIVIKKIDSSANSVTLLGTVDGGVNPIVLGKDSVSLSGNGTSWDQI